MRRLTSQKVLALHAFDQYRPKSESALERIKAAISLPVFNNSSAEFMGLSRETGDSIDTNAKDSDLPLRCDYSTVTSSLGKYAGRK
jgi:hypothetical protein